MNVFQDKSEFFKYVKTTKTAVVAGYIREKVNDIGAMFNYIEGKANDIETMFNDKDRKANDIETM